MEEIPFGQYILKKKKKKMKKKQKRKKKSKFSGSCMCVSHREILSVYRELLAAPRTVRCRQRIAKCHTFYVGVRSRNSSLVCLDDTHIIGFCSQYQIEQKLTRQ